LPADGSTLVLLADETNEAGGEPRVTARTISVSTLPLALFAPPDPPPDPSAVAVHHITSDSRVTELFGPDRPPTTHVDPRPVAHPVWTEALRADPEVRAFLDAAG
jgi:hypothetical protein